MSDISRRTLLVAGAGGAGALVLAGCSSSGDGTSNDPISTTTTSGSSSTASSTAPAPSSSGAASSAAGGTPLASVSDLKVNTPKAVKLANGSNGILTLTSQTTAVAFSAKCTHEGCTVKTGDGTTLNCPCHQSQFNATTGAVLQGPASSPLDKIAVTITGGEVFES